jgi:hypothetical protein
MMHYREQKNCGIVRFDSKKLTYDDSGGNRPIWRKSRGAT